MQINVNLLTIMHFVSVLFLYYNTIYATLKIYQTVITGYRSRQRHPSIAVNIVNYDTLYRIETAYQVVQLLCIAHSLKPNTLN